MSVGHTVDASSINSAPASNVKLMLVSRSSVLLFSSCDIMSMTSRDLACLIGLVTGTQTTIDVYFRFIVSRIAFDEPAVANNGGNTDLLYGWRNCSYGNRLNIVGL